MSQAKSRVQICAALGIGSGRAKSKRARQTVRRAFLTQPRANGAVLEPVLRQLEPAKLKKAVDSAFYAWNYLSLLLFRVRVSKR